MIKSLTSCVEMNDTEGKIASYLHETYHKLFKQGQPQITDFLQTAEQRQGMDAIDKFAKSKAKYPLLGSSLFAIAARDLSNVYRRHSRKRHSLQLITLPNQV
jgi:hypothetical protein